MYGYKKTFSRKAKSEFAAKMEEIQNYCIKHGITYSRTMDSYYFSLNGKRFRISNHTMAKSNAGAYNELGEKIRDLYHDDAAAAKELICIHASKLRIKEIYEALLMGYTLDGRGNIIK